MSPVDTGYRFYNDPQDDTSRSGVASTTISAAGTTQGAAFNVQDIIGLKATLGITAISGAGASLQLQLQVSDDGTSWTTLPNSIGALTTVTSVPDTFDVFMWTQARWQFVAAGTPSVTFNVTTQVKLAAQA